MGNTRANKVGSPSSTFTPLQGQYLAFIRAYTVINGIAPAEADMQRFFDVTPPAVHQMVLTLRKCGFITRVPGAARSICLLIAPEALPLLTEPSWRKTSERAIERPGEATSAIGRYPPRPAFARTVRSQLIRGGRPT
jgi:hypothetical protein